MINGNGLKEGVGNAVVRVPCECDMTTSRGSLMDQMGPQRLSVVKFFTSGSEWVVYCLISLRLIDGCICALNTSSKKQPNILSTQHLISRLLTRPLSIRLHFKAISNRLLRLIGTAYWLRETWQRI